MFKLKFLPARFGDSIWIEYGDPRKAHRLLIDGGTSGTRHCIRSELLALPRDQRRFELLVVSHIDRDHIEGILGLLSEGVPGLKVDDLWLNGYAHLPGNADDEHFGAVQAERLTQRILDLHLSWNEEFGGKRVVVPDGSLLPQKTLPGGMQITVLSPTIEALADLKPRWEQEVRDANLDPGFALETNDDVGPQEDEDFGSGEVPDVEVLAASEFEEDGSAANASSIALLAEFEGKRALLTADAHAGMLEAALERLSPGERISLNMFKVSHHGSKNTTSLELVKKVDCPVYVFSTNGSHFKHPHREAVSRVIMAGGEQPELVFNYRSASNEVWDLALLKRRYGYRTTYPAAEEEGIEVEL